MKSSAQCDYKYSKEKHEELNGALSEVVTNYFTERFPDVEVTKIDFSSKYTNEWHFRKEKAVARDHNFRINFKQKELAEMDFGEKVKNLMKAQTHFPVPEGKQFLLLGRTLLEQLAFDDNER